MYMRDSKGVKSRPVTMTVKDVGHRFSKESLRQGQDAYIVCFNITKQEQLLTATKLCYDIALSQESAKYKKPIVLVGCQSDNTDLGLVEYVDGERAGEALNAPYIECSAKLGENIEAVFDLVLTQVFKNEKARRDARK